MEAPPPPPPPHGENPRPSHPQPGSGLPPGNYDIFVIPPHASGGGFLYLPSLQPHMNSFIAGCACTFVVIYLYNISTPLLRELYGLAIGNGGGLGMVGLIIAVGIGAWAFGKMQAESKTGAKSGGGAGGGGAGASGSYQQQSHYARGPPPTSGYQAPPPQPGTYAPPPPPPPQPEPQPQPQSHAPPPQPQSHAPPPQPQSHAPPPQPQSHAPPPQPQSHAPPPQPQSHAPPPQPQPQAPPPSQSGWEKAREETRKREEERKRAEELKKRREEIQKAREEAERLAKIKAEQEKWEQQRAREKEKREREARERINKERLEREKAKLDQAREAREKDAREREAREKVARDKAEWERKRQAEKEKPATPTKPPSKAPSIPSAKYERPSAKSAAGTEEAHSYRPYDTPKKASTYNTAASSVSGLSESSYAPSHSTARTTPPPSHRGPYSTSDPHKIQIKAVYLFSDKSPLRPISQLVSGQGPVTDGLILNIETEGLFIDDDVREVPQREWDVKAWSLKLVEEGSGKNGLHLFRACSRDVDNKKYFFILDQSEAWKVTAGVARLRKGSQVRSLGFNTIKEKDVKEVLNLVGWL